MEHSMKFTIEQIAICPKDPSKAKQLLKDMGAVDWSEDRVKTAFARLNNCSAALDRTTKMLFALFFVHFSPWFIFYFVNLRFLALRLHIGPHL